MPSAPPGPWPAAVPGPCCPACGAAVLAADRYCGQCGTAQPPRAGTTVPAGVPPRSVRTLRDPGYTPPQHVQVWVLESLRDRDAVAARLDAPGGFREIRLRR
jgi:hypothetical protein